MRKNPGKEEQITMETFRPISNMAPCGAWGKSLCRLRQVADFQYHTIVKDLRDQLGKVEGILLDVGCGDSPYKTFLNANCRYLGIDIVDRNDRFGYNRGDILFFDENGGIPLADGSVDCILCTEVLEHVFDHPRLIHEMHRVLRPGGKLILTVPWSARYHYIPHDYFRYTASALERLFKEFSRVEIKTRGTDVTSICAKIIVVCAGMSSPSNKNAMRLLLLPLSWFLTIPLVIAAIGIGHLSLLFRLGSPDDPLGYTVLLEK
jgi:SAM-dependent methyltransferase